MSAPTPSQISLFDDDALRQLANQGQVRAYPKGAIIIHEGDVGDSIFMILAGRVKIYVSDDHGREMILDTRGTGNYVGEMSLDGGLRSATVMCLEPSTFSIVSRQRLSEAIAANPELALSLISTLARRARLATNLVKDLALLDVYGRVARLLRQLASNQEGGSWVVTERLTQQDIADRVGSSRDMITRIFKELTVGGYIMVRNRRITVLRPPPLRW